MPASFKSYNMVSTGSITIPVDLATSTPDVVYEDNIITGSVTLGGIVTIVAGGTPTAGQKLRIYWDATLSVPALTGVSVLGTALPFEILKNTNFIVECFYDGSAWIVSVLEEASAPFEVGEIDTADIADDAITNDKLNNMTRGTVKVGGTANAPTDLDAKTSGQILVGDGTDVASVAVSGDATLASNGALTIAASAATPAKVSDSVNQRQFTVSLEGDAAGKLGVIKYPMCLPNGGSCTVNGIYGTVKVAPATDTFSVVVKNNSSAVMTGGQIDVTTALALGNIVVATPSANNTFTNSGSPVYITLETSKTTAEACEVDITICYTITA